MPEGTKPLDPFDVPLEGASLIEASAGTGKTWTITRLYLRLLLETDLAVGGILAVTYTKAATAELKLKIRKLLEEARAAFASGEAPAGDDFLREALERHRDRKGPLGKIERALRDFDQAAVFTIHSFCQRVIAEQPLESGGPFETEILPDESLLLREAADDFWRIHVAGADPLRAAYLVDKGTTPDELLKGIQPWLAKPDLVLPGPGADDLSAAAEGYREAWSKAAEAWRGQAGAEAAEYLRGGSLRPDWYPPDEVDFWAGQLDAFLGPGSLPAPLGNKEMEKAKGEEGSMARAVNKFAASTVGRAVRKEKRPMPALAFPPLAEDLGAAHDKLLPHLDRWFRDLHVDLLRYVGRELPAKKERLRVLSYNDLLTRLRDALARDASLAGKVAGKYRAALIDEFQDTDPVQYEIFRRIFVDRERVVILVGDPKQAIYSFRGADVFSYLAARAAVKEAPPLTVNRRSAGKLVQAVNALFGKSANPFVLGEISFLPATPSDASRGELVAPDADQPPLRIWHLEGGDGKALGKAEAEDKAVKATAREIVRLLNADDIAIAGREEPRLRGSDIAVLVPNHRLGRAMRRRLAGLGVTCVQHSQDNVFETGEAEDVERVLRAVAEPGREDLLRAALVTDLLGMDGGDLYRLSLDADGWGVVLAEFRGYHDRWLRQGFMSMFRSLAQARAVAPRLLARREGERRLTNVFHLAELLHAASAAIGPAPERVIEWLALRRTQEGTVDDAALLRLESDEALVRIVTVHSSKGLEYPIVFCPFAWHVPDAARRKDQGITWHDARGAKGGTAAREVLDVSLSPPPEVVERARIETRAERLRLFYVAVTRARFRCYLVHGEAKGAQDSALAWLLGAHPGRKVLEEMAASSGGAIGVETIPEVPDGPQEMLRPGADGGLSLEPRDFGAGEVRAAWRVSSFSGLSGAAREAGTAAPEELPDHDQDAAVFPAPEEEAGPRLPAGPRIGTCLHAIFENLDFADTDGGKLRELAGRTLRWHAFGEEWTEPVAGLVGRALATPLDEQGAIRLRDVGGDRRLNEVKFHYPLRALEARRLVGVLRDGGLRGDFLSRLEGTGIETVAGFMTGSIDLVFEAGGRYHMADYKSNRLAGYGEAELSAEMAHSLYFLQYLVYTVAIHRYLGTRLPDYGYDTHFGGVFYLFLRGMDPERPGSGVFFDRPSRGLVEALDRYLAGSSSPLGGEVG